MCIFIFSHIKFRLLWLPNQVENKCIIAYDEKTNLVSSELLGFFSTSATHCRSNQVCVATFTFTVKILCLKKKKNVDYNTGGSDKRENNYKLSRRIIKEILLTANKISKRKK